MKHKRQQITAFEQVKNSNLTHSGNKFSGYLRTLRKQLSKLEDNYYHRLPNIPFHITGFRDTTVTGFYITWRYSSKFSFHCTSNYMSIGIRLKFMKGCMCICEPQMHVCICAYDKYAHMQGVNVKLQKRMNEDTVIKTDNAKHWDQTKFRNSCMYIIGL